MPETKQEYVQVQQRPYAVPPHADSKKHWVIAHDAVGPVQLDWTKGRLIGPDDLHQENRPQTHLTAREFDRLKRLGAIREATPEERRAYEAAAKAAEEAGAPFDSFFVGSDPVGGVQPMPPEEAAAIDAQERETRSGDHAPAAARRER